MLINCAKVKYTLLWGRVALFLGLFVSVSAYACELTALWSMNVPGHINYTKVSYLSLDWVFVFGFAYGINYSKLKFIIKRPERNRSLSIINENFDGYSHLRSYFTNTLMNFLKFEMKNYNSSWMLNDFSLTYFKHCQKALIKTRK